MSAIRIFISYAHEDEIWLRQWLDDKQQLRNRRYFLDFWDRSLRAENEECIFWWDGAEEGGLRGGDRWRARIFEEIDCADVVVLFITQDFVISPFIKQEELPRILARAKRDEVEVVPILLAPARWEKLDVHGMFQLTPGKPTPQSQYLDASENDWHNARLEVVEALITAVQRAKKRKHGTPIPPAARTPVPPQPPQPPVPSPPPPPFWRSQFKRFRHLAVGGVLIAAVIAVAIFLRWHPRSQPRSIEPVVTRSWTAVSTDGAPPARHSPSAVWTGEEYIVWGGSDDSVRDHAISGGARYNPKTRKWRPVSTVGSPPGQIGVAAYWTGLEMLIWGGINTNAGGLYDPKHDTWKSTSQKGAPSPRSVFNPVWTGQYLFTWGGYDAATMMSVDTGGRYDPRSDSWTPLPTEGNPGARSCHMMVWTGKYIVIWGGWNGTRGLATGGRYDIHADRWLPMSVTNAPAPRGCYADYVVWTGKEMLVWGGGIMGGLGIGGVMQTGARYDPEADVWRNITTAGAPEGRANHGLLWTGTRMLVWGGSMHSYRSAPGLATGGLYDPNIDAWEPITANGTAPIARTRFAAVRGDMSVFIWGGSDNNALLSDGALLGP